MYNLLIGGAAGQGIDTTAAILEKLLKKSGYNVFTYRDFMSRVRGGHNFIIIRFSTEEVYSHSFELDGIIALNEETISLHEKDLKNDGFILCDSEVVTDDKRAIKVAMKQMAKQLKNPRVSGTIAVGVILKLFSENLENVEAVLQQSLPTKYLDINIKAVQEGYDSVDNRYEKLNGQFKDWLLLTGSQALTLGSMAAGLKFYSAYPMSPATPIMVDLAAKSDKMGILVEQAEDEIAAINMAIGASFAGAKAMTATSGGGLALMVEAIGLAGMAEIPIVLVDVQRPGPATGLPTRTGQEDLKFVISTSPGEFPRMVIALRNHEDAFYQTVRAFDIAERYQIPVIILSDQYLGDSSATVKPFDLNNLKISEPSRTNVTDYLRYRYSENGISERLIPGVTDQLVVADSDEHDEAGKITESAQVRNKMMDKRMKKLAVLESELQEPDFLGPDNFETLLLGWGSMYGPLEEAIKILNSKQTNKYAALVFGDVYPLPDKLLKAKAKTAKTIINVEQNATGQLASVIKEYTGISCTSSILKYDGRQINAQQIVDEILGGHKNA